MFKRNAPAPADQAAADQAAADQAAAAPPAQIMGAHPNEAIAAALEQADAQSPKA